MSDAHLWHLAQHGLPDLFLGCSRRGLPEPGMASAAHERVASLHERSAASGIGHVRQHQQQAAPHRAAATADWQRAGHARSLLSEPERPGPG